MKKLTITLALVASLLLVAGASAQGTGPQGPKIAVSPTSYDFGEVPIGALAYTDITISNVGGAPLVVYTVRALAPFGAGFTPTVTIPPNRSIRVSVYFAPSQPVSYDGICWITSNDGSNPAVTVALHGEGIEE